MTSQDFSLYILQISVMLLCAVILGQLMRRIGQPAIVGEIIGGIVLGPTVFGALLPSLYSGLFQASGNVNVLREASIKLGMLFFLFIAGLEVNLADFRRLGRRAVLIGLIGTILPILIGVGLVYALPRPFWGNIADDHLLYFALFIGMNFANSANPVIARILMDLGLLKEDTGVLIMTATVIDDLINWTLFAIILSNIVPTSQTAQALPTTISFVVIFFVAVLGVGRWLMPRILERVRQHVAFPTGFIAIVIVTLLVVSAVAELLGLNAFLGAFLIGTALSGTTRSLEVTQSTISQFILSFFAPIYFVSMGLNANFVADFDLPLVTVMLLVACASKIGSVLLGARAAGMPIDRKTLAISFGLNARGATGIILAGVGLEHGLIDTRMFVALVIVALITSVMAGTMIRRLVEPFASAAPAKYG